MTKIKNYGLSRKTETKLPYTRFVVFSEGKNTEPEYLKSLSKSLSRVLVKLQIYGGEGTPNTLAETAISYIRGTSRRRDLSSYEKNDQVWIMFDRDEHPKVKETIDNFQRAGLKVAYSNPCFEIWLVLHFEDFDRPYDRHKMQSHLEKICPSYSVDNGKKPDCSLFIAKVGDAETRARAMSSRRIKEDAEFGPPYTDVYKLTDAMRGASQKQAKRR
jgi:hypothetical protein